MTEYYIDLSEFIVRPHATGIQRTCGELCKHWPSNVPLKPMVLNAHGQWAPLPTVFLKKISQFVAGKTAHRAKITKWLNKIKLRCDQSTNTLKLDKKSIIIVPEVFFDLQRINWYRKNLAQFPNLFFLIYDFFPILYPNYILDDLNYNIYAYFKLISEVNHVAFISNRTREEYWQRLRRISPGVGPVIRCGSNGLKNDSKKTPLPVDNLTFLVVGSVSPKKKHGLILDAFEALWNDNIAVKLTFAGGFYHDEAMAARLDQLVKNNPLFSYFPEIDDQQLKKLYIHSRASICIGLEGYGLPAVESLFFKRPVIIGDTVPSVEHFTQGVLRLETTTIESLKKAVLRLLNNHFYQEKVQEIPTHELPTWELFAQQFAGWIKTCLRDTDNSHQLT